MTIIKYILPKREGQDPVLGILWKTPGKKLIDRNNYWSRYKEEQETTYFTIIMDA